MTDQKNLNWTRVKLTPLDIADLDLIYEWQNDPAIRDLTMGFRFPIQRETARAWLESIRNDNAKSRIVFGIRADGDLKGVVQLHTIDHYQRKALLGIYIGSHDERGKGLGYISTSLVLDYAFNGLDLRKVSLDVLSTNTGAIKLYEALGFVREGVKRADYFLDGVYLDTYFYGLMRDEFKKNIPATAHRLIG